MVKKTKRKLTAVKRKIKKIGKKPKKLFKKAQRQCQKIAENKARILLAGCLFIIAGGLFLLLKNISHFQPAAAAGIDVWWDAYWPNRKKLTFNNSGQTTDNLIYFPVLVHLTSSNFDFNRAQEHGEDIRFTDPDRTLLTYEIEKWDKTNKKADIWVRVPQIDAGSATDYIWMYYGNSHVSGDSDNVPRNTWDANYKGVWHLSEGSGTSIFDSAGTPDNGSLFNTNPSYPGSWTTGGQIAGAYNFYNLSNYASVTNSLSLGLTDAITMEAWMNPAGNSDIIGNIDPDVSKTVKGNLNICGPHCLPTSIFQMTDTIYVVAVKDTQNNNWWLKTVEISREGEIMRIINTSSTYTDGGEGTKVIHISGDVYAVCYIKTAMGYLKTFTINSQGFFGPIITTYIWDGTPMVGGFDIIHLTGNYYALTYTQHPDGYVQRLIIDQNGQVAASGSRLRFNDDVQSTHIISLAGEYYAIVYEGEDMHGLVQTVKIPTSGAISLVDAFEWAGSYQPGPASISNPQIIKITGSSDKYAIVFNGLVGPDTTVRVRTIQISNSGIITESIFANWQICSPRCFSERFVHIANDVYALAYRAPPGFETWRNGWIKTFAIDPSGKAGPLIKSFEFETDDHTRDINGMIPTVGDIYALVYATEIGYPTLEWRTWLKTVKITTNTGIFKSDAYALDSNRSLASTTINDELMIDAPRNTGWRYLASTYDKNQSKLYVDGALSASSAYNPVISTNGNDFFIGYLDKGYIDEVRLSSAARSADWLKAQHLSMTDQFITFSEEKWRRGDYWAWTDTFGWFNLDCPSDLCGSSAYRLTLPDDPPLGEPKPITGWIWSENVGWVCFGSSCCGIVGVDCTTPDLSGADATYTKTENSSEIKGWAKVWALGGEGWLKLRCDYEDDDDCEVDPAQFSNFPFCYDCYLDEGASKCRICYTSSEYDGSGNICSGCIRCGGGGEPNTCGECSSCYQYGIACRQNISDLGCLTGWAWNGNWDCSVLPCSDTGQPGLGWFTFNFGSSIIVPPWLQTQWGDVYSGGDIKGLAGTPPGTPPNKQYNATYLIHANGTVENFESWWCQEHPEDELNCGKQSFGTLLFPKKETNYFGTLGRIDLAGIKKGYYGPVVECDCNTNPSCANNLPAILDGKVYHFTGDCEVNSPINISSNQLQKGNGLVLVEGNLIIKANVNYSDSTINKLRNLASVGWLVIDDGSGTKGNIVIGPSVTELAGVFYGENKIWSSATYIGGIISGVSSPTLLDVTGLMVSKNFAFNRTVGSYLRGAEVVIDDGRAIANTPPGMEDLVKGLPTWQATAP